MPGKDNPRVEEQATHRPPADDTRRLLNTLDQVFSTFRGQLHTETPRPFTVNAQIAVDTFNDIVAGLRFESRPRAITIAARSLSATEIELTWTDVPNNADGYRIERCDGYNCSDFDDVARLTPLARSFCDTNLSEHTLYRYRVIAFNVRGEAVSNVVEVTPATRRQDSKETRNV